MLSFDRAGMPGMPLAEICSTFPCQMLQMLHSICCYVCMSKDETHDVTWLKGLASACHLKKRHSNTCHKDSQGKTGVRKTLAKLDIWLQIANPSRSPKKTGWRTTGASDQNIPWRLEVPTHSTNWRSVLRYRVADRDAPNSQRAKTCHVQNHPCFHCSLCNSNQEYMKIQLLPACPVKIGTTSKRTLQQGIAIIKNEINQTSTVPQIPVTSWYSLVPLASFYTHLLACLRFPIWKGSSYSSRVCTLLMAAASMSTNCPSYLVSQLFLHAKEFTWHLTHAICFSRATCVHVFYRAGITISWSAWRCSARADPFHSSSQHPPTKSSPNFLGMERTSDPQNYSCQHLTSGYLWFWACHFLETPTAATGEATGERKFSQTGGGVWRLEVGMISFPQLVGNLSSSLLLEEWGLLLCMM